MANTTNTRAATSHIAPFGVRMQPELKERLEQAAQQAGRSLNAEIVNRLEASLAPPPQPVGTDLTWNLTSEIKQLAEAQGIPFDEMLVKIFAAGLHPQAPEVFYVALMPGTTKEEFRIALDQSNHMVKPNATLMVEMLQRAPWAPAWVAERLKESLFTAEKKKPAAKRIARTPPKGKSD